MHSEFWGDWSSSDRQKSQQKSAQFTEEDDKKVENSAIAFLKEGVSVEIIAKCLELPKKRVRELAKSLTATIGS